jgi:hypothetical protein
MILPIGRIMKSSGVPSHIPQWWWGCNVYGKPSLDDDSGTGTDLNDCKAKFMIAWTWIHARLTDNDIKSAHQSLQSQRRGARQI